MCHAESALFSRNFDLSRVPIIVRSRKRRGTGLEENTTPPLCLTGGALLAFGQVSFSGLDLSPADRLLFAATTHGPDFGLLRHPFPCRCRARSSMRQLTFFPEDIQLLQDKDVLQIQNRFGVFRSEQGFRNITPLAMFASFVAGSQIQVGQARPDADLPGRQIPPLPPVALSGPRRPDPARRRHGRGNRDFREGRAFSAGAPGALVTGFAVHRVRQGLQPLLLFPRPAPGEARACGSRCAGSATAPSRASAGQKTESLYYISGVIVYEINPSELFTRALYAGFLEDRQGGREDPVRFRPQLRLVLGLPGREEPPPEQGRDGTSSSTT